MSGFTDMMIEDGFCDPQAYLDYLEALATEVQNRIEKEEREREEYYKMYGEDYEVFLEERKKNVFKILTVGLMTIFFLKSMNFIKATVLAGQGVLFLQILHQ